MHLLLVSLALASGDELWLYEDPLVWPALPIKPAASLVTRPDLAPPVAAQLCSNIVNSVH